MKIFFLFVFLVEFSSHWFIDVLDKGQHKKANILLQTNVFLFLSQLRSRQHLSPSLLQTRTRRYRTYSLTQSLAPRTNDKSKQTEIPTQNDRFNSGLVLVTHFFFFWNVEMKRNSSVYFSLSKQRRQDELSPFPDTITNIVMSFHFSTQKENRRSIKDFPLFNSRDKYRKRRKKE